MLSATEIERSILGCIMNEKSLVCKLEELQEEMFSGEDNKYIFNIMMYLYKNDSALDLAGIMSVVKSRKNIGEESCRKILVLLTEMTAVYNSVYIDEHISTLKEFYRKNSLAKLANSVLFNIGNGKDVATTLSIFDKGAKKIMEDESVENDDIFHIANDMLDLLESDREKGFKFGIPLLDDVIGGLYECELITIAGRSGSGKSALAQQIMLNVVAQGKKVLFVSREMSALQVLMRNITKKTGISSKKMKYKDLEVEDWENIVDYINDVTKDKLIYINDSISTVGGIRNRIRQIKPDLVIVDYVQLLNPEERLQSREREVATLSRELKNITLDFEIPVIQLSQLNDEMKDYRPSGERPMRDSKAIFHDSNSVVYVHEPVGNDFEKAVEACELDRYRVKQMKKEGIKLMDLIVAKCRDGETTFRNYWFNGPRLHFEEILV